MIHAKHPLAKFKALPFRRSFMQVPPATSCLAIHFVCIPGQKGGEQSINVLFNDFLSPAFSLTLSKGKENSRRNCPKVFSPVAHGVIAQTRNVFVPTLSVVFPNSWAVRERSVHHHTQHLSQAWRGTPQVHQPPLVSMIPVWVQGSHKKNLSTGTQGTYQVKTTCSYWVWLHKQECTIFTTCCTNHKYDFMWYHNARSFSSWCSSRALVSKPTAKASFYPLRASCPKTTCRAATFAKLSYSQTHHIPYIPQKWVCVEPSQPSKCTSEKMI